MGQLSLVIGNKNYSSWSLRPWLLMKMGGLPCEEIRLQLYAGDSAQRLHEYSPSGKVPVLLHGDAVIWDSLAICEYLAERFPQLHAWPEDAAARAHARSVSAEMHSGFLAMRQGLPMNCRIQLRDFPLSEDVQRDVDRVQAIWQDCRQRYAGQGEWLFGGFSIADAMFAPVALRCATYGVALAGEAAVYRDRVLALPAIQEWVEAGRRECDVTERAEGRI